MAGLKINKSVAKEAKVDKVSSACNDDKNIVKDSDMEFDDFESPMDAIIQGSDNVENAEEGEDDDSSSSKTKIKLIAIGGVVILVIAVGVVALVSNKGVEDEDMSAIGGFEVEEPIVEEPIVEESVEDEVVSDSEVVDGDGSESPTIKSDNVVYENTLLGLALKYPSNWYVEERADLLLNLVQSTSASGNIDLLTNEVKLASVVIDFSARDDLGTKVSLGISPLVLTGDTQVAEINSLSDILNVGTASQIDEQIKVNIAASGGTLLESTPSIVKDVGAYKVVQSVYQFEKNGIKMDIIQMLVPYGVNNIILTCSSKAGDNPINKEELLINMIGSLGKVGEVTLVDEDTLDGEIEEGETTTEEETENTAPKTEEGVKKEGATN